MAEQRWFTVRGWQVARWPDYICVSKTGRVSHSVRIERSELVEHAFERLKNHVLEAYPKEAHVATR